ncbi:aspartate kinase [Desulfoluna limicola]|uniref:aspartate kinase n=1 Tax=Desulfoluna limicola TaxID=2810562 RepID=A0ABM7PHF2_9BACT|nr:aspartate kinase [Desulfoluna limicola]BCS97007.1 aspartate kinase [Desulfoluna limicola]
MTHHTVEKIGGTTMSQFDKVLDNILIGDRSGSQLYNRIIVVSAYGGVTDLLLEHKKNREQGVYALFSESDSSWTWSDAISKVSDHMCRINAELEPLGLDISFADRFVRERIEGVRSCLLDLTRLCSYGHFQLDEHLMTVREMLSAIGEAHSAHNTYQILSAQGINARFVDLSGWMETENLAFEEKIRQAFADIDLENELPIVTGYTQCREGLMDTYDRGYTEMTFSKVAVITEAREGIIHKEFHLSSADPKTVGEDKTIIIGGTNYDVSDQLSDLGMEAIHPQAAKGMRKSGIPLRIKNAFEPEHPGTLITSEYKSTEPRVEIIAGRNDVTLVECWDQDMVGHIDRDTDIMAHFTAFGLRSLAKDINANTITHYVSAPLNTIKKLSKAIKQSFPSADILIRKVALVSILGSNMNVPGILHEAVLALTEAGIDVHAIHKCMRPVGIQFVVDEELFQDAVKALHVKLLEEDC